MKDGIYLLVYVVKGESSYCVKEYNLEDFIKELTSGTIDTVEKMVFGTSSHDEKEEVEP